VSLDLKLNAPSTFSIEAPAIQLFRLEDTGVISHISYINSKESRTGPFPFFDSGNLLIAVDRLMRRFVDSTGV